MAISDDVRTRVLETVYAKDRDLAWMARVVGKSKGWGTAFKSGTGSLNHTEMRQLAGALEVSEEFLWDGVTSPVTRDTDDGMPLGASMTYTGHEQMIVAIYRQLSPARQQALMDVLTRLLREQTHVPTPPREPKK